MEVGIAHGRASVVDAAANRVAIDVVLCPCVPGRALVHAIVVVNVVVEFILAVGEVFRAVLLAGRRIFVDADRVRVDPTSARTRVGAVDLGIGRVSDCCMIDAAAE